MTAPTYSVTVKPLDLKWCGAFSARLAATGAIRAKREAEAIVAEYMAGRPVTDAGTRVWCAVTMFVRDADGDVTDRHLHITGRPGWKSIGAADTPVAKCHRCGGHGRESVTDDHCYACGRRGGNARKHSRSTTGLE